MVKIELTTIDLIFTMVHVHQAKSMWLAPEYRPCRASVAAMSNGESGSGGMSSARCGEARGGGGLSRRPTIAANRAEEMMAAGSLQLRWAFAAAALRKKEQAAVERRHADEWQQGPEEAGARALWVRGSRMAGGRREGMGERGARLGEAVWTGSDTIEQV